MKKHLLSILILVLTISFTGSVYAQSNRVIKEEKIKTGFHCPNGKAMIEKELVKTDGVTSVLADLDTKIVTVKFVEGKTNRQELIKAIEKIGYTTEDTKPGTTINKACSHDQPQN